VTTFIQSTTWLGPITHSGITLTAIAAVALNAFFNGVRGEAKIADELVNAAKAGSLE
jgi:uric acid transporter